MRNIWGRSALTALALALTACGDTIKFPGIDDSTQQPSSDPVEEPTDSDVPTPITDPVSEPESDLPLDPVPDPVPEPDPDTETDSEEDPISETDPALEPDPPAEPTFEYYPPGNLIPGSGQGSLTDKIFAPDMVFPVMTDPTIPQSQVFRPGGGFGSSWQRSM